MKLDKTLEELIAQNKTLTEAQYITTREYFKLRMQQEDKLSNLKKIQAEQIIQNKIKLKLTKNISMEKIHKYTVKYKRVINSENIDKIANSVFKDLISEFDYNCAYHYENNKDIIINYITEFYKLHSYMLDVKKELKSELKTFNRNISTNLLIQLVSEYTKFKRNIEVIEQIDYDFIEFKSILEQQEKLTPITTEIFLTRVDQIKNKSHIKDIVKEKEALEDISISNNVNKNIEVINSEIKSQKKKEIYSIVHNAYRQIEHQDSNEEEKSIETILIDNEETKELAKKLCEAPPKKEKVEKPKLTKEERAIKKAKEKARDELYNLTMKKMFSGLI